MIKYLQGSEIAAEVKLIRAAFSGAITIVEGESDYKLYEKFLDLSKCYPVQSYGRENLLEALSCLNAESFEGVVGIADADFWRIHGGIPSVENLVITDYHDLEIIMLKSKALDALLNEYGSAKKISSFFTGKAISTPRSWLFRQAECLARLRLVAAKNNVPLKFDALKFSRFVPRSTVEADDELCLNAVLANTSNRDITVEDLKDELSKLPKKVSQVQLCCGHDLVEILSIALRQRWGSLVKAISEVANLEKMLRMAYSQADFERTDVHRQLLKWQSANSPFQLFS